MLSVDALFSTHSLTFSWLCEISLNAFSVTVEFIRDRDFAIVDSHAKCFVSYFSHETLRNQLMLFGGRL